MPTTYTQLPRPHLDKGFAWSFSRLNNFETCARQHLYTDLMKSYGKGDHPALGSGLRVHDAIAKYITKDVPLSAEAAAYRDEIDPWVRKNDPAGTVHIVEENLAIRRDFSPCGGFDAGVWFRAKTDFAKVYGPLALAIDWKTGKIKEDRTQLASMAQCIFSHYPAVKMVRTVYAWLGNHATTVEEFFREDMPHVWQLMQPRIDQYEASWQNLNFPPNPSGLCLQYCNVQNCEFYKKGNKRS